MVFMKNVKNSKTTNLVSFMHVKMVPHTKIVIYFIYVNFMCMSSILISHVLYVKDKRPLKAKVLDPKWAKAQTFYAFANESAVACKRMFQFVPN